MRFYHQGTDCRPRYCLPFAQFMRGQHQQGACQEAGLCVSRRDQRPGIGNDEWPKARKCTNAGPCPQAPGDGHPGYPCDRKRQGTKGRDSKQERRRIDECEPSLASRPRLDPLLQRQIIGGGGIPSYNDMTRPPEGKEIGARRPHCLHVGIGQHPNADEREEQCVAAHSFVRQPVRPAQPVHRRPSSPSRKHARRG